jgi:hypothetical protein
MPAPASATYSVAAKVAAHTALLALIDTGAGAGSIVVLDDADVTLAVATLTDPAGTVNGTTGQLTLTAAAGEDSAPAAGIAAYAEVRDVAGTVQLALPCQAGTAPVSGKCVLSTLTIGLGDAVDVVSITIG